MTLGRGRATGIRGHVHAHAAALRGWTRHEDGQLMSRLMRCKREEWYLARARLAEGAGLRRAGILVHFVRAGAVVDQRCVWLHGPGGAGHRGELLGWVRTPKTATHMQLSIVGDALPAQIAAIEFNEVSERDPKCHPLANIPRWSTYRTPFTIQRVVLPTELRALAPLIDGLEVQLAERSATLADLSRMTRGAACVLEPNWTKACKLTLADIERLAAAAWLIVDLETLSRLVAGAGLADAEIVTDAAPHGLMSARVEYADVPTRGLALQDVVPYSVIDDVGHFRMRAIRASRSWRHYADDVGFATLLSSETPWERQHADVLSAVRAVGGGELITTDLPWLVAGRHGRLLAPAIAEHLVRMHLTAPIKEHVQYWNRWGDMNVIVRDIADLASRYAPLHAVRWAGNSVGVAHLGLALRPADGPARRHLLIRTGRIDTRVVHAGLPPEPMMIFMKWLAREARERTPWAGRHLTQTAVTWQFDTADGLKYATHFDAADPPAGVAMEVINLRLPQAGGVAPAGAPANAIVFEQDEGLHGDASLIFQDTLTNRLRRFIERRSSGWRSAPHRTSKTSLPSTAGAAPAATGHEKPL